MMSVAAGCNADIADDGSPSGSDGAAKAGRIEALIDDETTCDVRNSLTDKDGERYILWSEGDVIGIFGSAAGRNVAATVDPEFVGTRRAVFDYLGDVEGIFCGYYPYNANASINGDVLTTALPARQTYSPTSVFASNTTIMAGYVRGEENVLEFKNACAILEIQLTGSELIKSLSLTSGSQPLAGNGSVNLRDEQPVFKIRSADTSAQYCITLDLGEGVRLTSAPTPFYFVVPAGTYDDLTLVTEGEGFVCHRRSVASHTLQVRHIAPMKPIEVKRPSLDAAVDLSVGGTSNCYLVSPSSEAKTYSFDAKLVDGTAVGGGVIADYLWKSSENLIGDIVYDAASGKIGFTVGADVSGNALISLLDDKGTAVWSWHIWVSDIEEQTFGSPALTFLDRAIGATYAPKSVEDVKNLDGVTAARTGGMMYQWGRNIPFPGAETFDHHTERYESGTTGGDYSDATNKDGVAYGKKCFTAWTRKMIFNKRYPEYGAFEMRNLYKTAAEMAAYPLSFNKLFANRSAVAGGSWASDAFVTSGDARWGEQKTNTDPCPVGYRVPEHDELFYFRNDNLADGGYYKYTHNNLNNTTGRDYGGYVTTTTGEFIWMPRSGFRTSGYNNANSNGWSGTLTAVGTYASGNATGRTEAGNVCWWTYKKDDTAASLAAAPNGWHNKAAAVSGDVYQRFLIMIGAGNCFYQETGASWWSVHASATACEVRCVKQTN